MRRFLYSAWDGSGETDVPPAHGVLDALMQELLKYGDMEWAMQELLRRGYTSPDGTWSIQGVDEFMQQLEAAREAWLQRYAADSFRLSETQVERYHQQIDAATQAMSAQFDQLRTLPYTAPTAQARYGDREAGLYQRYEALQRELATRQGTPPPDRQSEMTQRLDDLLPQLYPDPEDAVEPAETQQPVRLRNRSQLMRRRHAALTAIERYLDRALRVEQRLSAFPFCGSEPLGVAAAERLLQELHYLDDLLRRMRWHPGRMIDINPERLQHLLDQAGVAPSQQLEKLEALLEQAGLVRRTDAGLRLTQQGIRYLGANILNALFHHSTMWQLRQKTARQTGVFTHETKPYDFGDAFCLDLTQTLAEATRRQPGVPVQLQASDFAVYRPETRTSYATALVLDMSQSMAAHSQHRFAAAKKVALALAQFIRVHFPQDILYIVGFGDNAKELRMADLPFVTAGREHTNTQAGLQRARQLLNRQRGADKQIVMITDGRPTAARHANQLYRHTRELHPVILDETYKEAKRCRQQGIRLNTFMLADDPPLMAFVKRLTALSQGRAFYTTPEHLGAYVIEDYVNQQRS
ncbi:VWA domain-containing protein [Candidatus Entotheonella palauensis]|uniref:VWA domain-containing protein n=1 Tax=Candidatus Entotheonella palauensis TaxID=93172 RepID=UPI0015C4A538|nr:VWA domain-containing protein [Candidatus Entotheonella palauensis]